MKKLLSIILSVILFCGLATSCVDESQSSLPVDDLSSTSDSGGRSFDDDEPISITAAELSKAYDDDEKAARETYEGKMLEITGKVSSISLLDNVHLDRETKEAYINCVMVDPDFDVDTIHVGDTVRIRGKMADGFLSLKLEQCTFIEIVESAESSSSTAPSETPSEAPPVVSSEEPPEPSSALEEPPEEPEPPEPQETPQSAMVWVTAKGKKYHSTSTCSNMKNPYQITEEEAIASGRGPCSKCH